MTGGKVSSNERYVVHEESFAYGDSDRKKVKDRNTPFTLGHFHSKTSNFGRICHYILADTTSSLPLI